MFFKKLDHLSPPVTFYHHGDLSHSSIISGILSIVSFSLIVVFAINYILELIRRNDPKAFSFNSFAEDAGIFPVNSSSLFHFISIASFYTNNTNQGVDFTMFRIVGFETYYEMALYDSNLSHYDHWLYGKCNNQSDTEGISNIITYDYYENSACIRKYFSFTEQKYYDTNDPKFRWPEIAHGTYNSKYKIYSVLIQQCNQDSLDIILGKGHKCQNKAELYENLSYYGIAYFYFINHYLNVLNYENPLIKFVYPIETFLAKNNYIVNNINLNPARLKTHNGIIFDNIQEINAYIFDRNDAVTSNNEGLDIYSTYIFWLKNSMIYSERNYKRFQDIVSTIGGIYQAITILFIYMNSLYHQYIVLSDTQILLFSSIYEDKINQEKTRLKNKDLKHKIKDSKNNKTDLNISKEKIIDEKLNYRHRKDVNKENASKSYNFVSSHDNLNISNKNDTIANEIPNKAKTFKMKNKKFFDFILFKCTCGKKDKNFELYNNFRTKILSEEHLMKKHLNIYNLLRVTEKRRAFRRNSYQLHDLIKLI